MTPPEDVGAPVLDPRSGLYRGGFHALGGPCEVLVDTADPAFAHAAVRLARAEALRIEHKFSRYRDDSVVAAIHAANGRALELDGETAHLLDYAATCHALSAGRFDITSGVFRRIWTFDGGTHVPTAEEVRATLAFVGWQRVTWRPPMLVLPAGMEIDLGGIGKEYAVDRAATCIGAAGDAPVLVNFGGDLFASAPRRDGRAWGVAIDDPEHTGEASAWQVELDRGGLATSGDARRFVMHEGRRLGHILDPRTGWPVADAPRSVTVLGPTCVEAGTLSTLAMLAGPGAREFLESQGVSFHLF